MTPIETDERTRLLRMPQDQLVHEIASEREATARWRAVAERRGDAGPFAGMPWYMRALAWFGLPVVLVAFYLGQDAGWIPSLARTTHANVLLTTAAFAAHAQKTDALVERMATAMRIMCENGARDQAQRNNCGLIR